MSELLPSLPAAADPVGEARLPLDAIAQRLGLDLFSYTPGDVLSAVDALQSRVARIDDIGRHNGMMLPGLSHAEVAGKVRMLMRNDLDHEMVTVLARNRIIVLADELGAALAAATTAEARHREKVAGYKAELAEQEVAKLALVKENLSLKEELRQSNGPFTERERLENWINELENSFGYGGFRDGQTEHALKAARRELAELLHGQGEEVPAAASGTRAQEGGGNG